MTELSPRELEYIECPTPMLSGVPAVMRLATGILQALVRAVVVPSSEYNNADSKLVRTVREIRYTKYKKAVLRKQSGTPKKGDGRLLSRLERTPFVLQEDTYDPDRFVEEVYAEYMKNHTEKEG